MDEENATKIRKYSETNENKNATYKNLQTPKHR